MLHDTISRAPTKHPTGGVGPSARYDTSADDGCAFMGNHARVEPLKSLFERLIWPVQGISPLKD